MVDISREIQLQLPSPKQLLTPAVTTILILMVIGYTLTHYATRFTLENLVLTDSVLNNFKVWQLFTYSFISGGCGLLFNGCIVLFLGSAIEREWKTRATSLLILTVIVACGITWMLFNLLLGRNYPGMGSSSIAYGFIGAFGILFRRQRFLAFLWTVEAQTIAWILIAIGIIFGIASPLTWIWVGGALVAYAVIKAKWALQSRGSRHVDSSRIRQKGFVDLD